MSWSDVHLRDQPRGSSFRERNLTGKRVHEFYDFMNEITGKFSKGMNYKGEKLKLKFMNELSQMT